MWWIPLIASLVGTGINAYTGYKQAQELNKIKQPSKEDFQLTPEQKNAYRQGMLSNLGRQNMVTQKNIKQFGAAKRLPSGAITSALAGANENLAKGAANIEGELAKADVGGNTRYAAALQNWQANRANTMMGIYGGQNNYLQTGLGALSNIFMLSQAGYFDNPIAGGANTGQLPRFDMNAFGSYQMPQYPFRSVFQMK